MSGLQARNLETRLNEKIAGAGRSVSSGDRFLVMARKGKYVDASLYQPGQADQLNRNTPDVDTKRILQAEAVGFDGENISFRDVTDDVLAQEMLKNSSSIFKHPSKIINAKNDQIYVVFNKTHKASLPKPKSYGPHGGWLQSHHGIQRAWANENLKGYGYDPELAPTITIETGAGLPHTMITNRQYTRMQDRLNAGKGKWSSTLQDELQFLYDDLSSAGFSETVIEDIMEQQYKMLDKLRVKYERLR